MARSLDSGLRPARAAVPRSLRARYPLLDKEQCSPWSRRRLGVSLDESLYGFNVTIARGLYEARVAGGLVGQNLEYSIGAFHPRA